MIFALATGGLNITVCTPALAAQDAPPPNSSKSKDTESPHKTAKENPDTDSAKPKSAEHVSVEKVTPDEAIQKRLADILRATEWFSDVRVKVRDSVAFLDGAAVDDDRKQWAAQLAHNTEGVAAVVNRIQVRKTLDVSGTWKIVVTSVKSLWDDFLMQSPLIVAGLLTLVVTAFVSRFARYLVSRLAQRSRLRTSLQDLVLQLVVIGVWIVGLLLAAIIMFPGMTPSKALAVLGLGSIAVGFAFKDIFENFFAGILILWKYPFDRGDFIECSGIKGKIQDITIRMSTIQQVDGEIVVVPNALLFKNPVNVLTSGPSRRTTVLCGVAYDTDLDEAQSVIQKAVESCSTVRQDNPVQIYSQEFADSNINFEVTWWTGATPQDIRESRDEVVRAVKKALDEAKIEIPFPQRTLWLPKPVETRDYNEPAKG